MHIICSTTTAAAQVLSILLLAELHPLRDYQLSPVLSTTPPIIFTMIHILTSAQLASIRAIPDTSVEGQVAV
jgi:hypothetical protein